MMGAQADIGPSGPRRWQIYARAKELRALAELATALAVSGPGQDLPRALAQFDRMRAILGECGE
ncbi:MAG: hypothetical protein FP826_01555 [Sphingomonadales bacterium]|nr:hypothetical protein [Sphingomonadales bacterium]MBU3993749.1 hypothetical protein [Alphaproteobacteria bacterium]